MVSVTGIIQFTALMSFSAEAMSSSLRWVPSGKVIVEQPLVPEITRKSTSIDARSNLSAWWGRGMILDILDILGILDITFGPFFSFSSSYYFLLFLPFSSLFFPFLLSSFLFCSLYLTYLCGSRWLCSGRLFVAKSG
jgi:hypothetical protein